MARTWTKVAGVTFGELLRAAVTRKDPKEFLFFNCNAVGEPAAEAFVGRLAGRTLDRDKKVSVKAFLTHLRAIKRWARSAPPTCPRSLSRR